MPLLHRYVASAASACCAQISVTIIERQFAAVTPAACAGPASIIHLPSADACRLCAHCKAEQIHLVSLLDII